MRSLKVYGLNLLAVLGLVTSAWAFCPEDKKEAQAGSQPCPHAKGDGSAMTASGEVKVEEKSGGCAKKDCCKKKGDASLTSDKAGGCAKKSGACPVQAALASMPAMKYRVADETVACPKTAEEMAIKKNTTITYVVGEKTYAKKGEAVVALASLLETEVANLVSVQTAGAKSGGCSHADHVHANPTATPVAYKVGGMEVADKAKAEKAAKLAADAVGAVKLSYKVGDDKFCCDKMAGVKAKETGKSVTFVVGDEETCCQDMAKLLLAQARVKAAVEAAVSALNS